MLCSLYSLAYNMTEATAAVSHKETVSERKKEKYIYLVF